MEILTAVDLYTAIRWVFDYCQKGTEPKTVEETKKTIEDIWEAKILDSDIHIIEEYFQDKELFMDHLIEKENDENKYY
jgi:hypothetical protein